MIRKLLISLFVIVFGFIGFSNASVSIDAEHYGEVGLDSHTSPLNNAIDIGFLKGGSISSSFIGQTYRFFVLKDNTYAFWSWDGRFYAVAPNLQGYFPGFYICDKMNGGYPSNCGWIDNGGSFKTTLKAFFMKVKATDHYYYKYNYTDVCGGGGCSYVNQMTVCWDSAELNKSLCFDYYRCNNNHACNVYNRGGDLIDSMGITDTYNNLDLGLVGYAPGTVMYDDGSIDSSTVGGGTSNAIHCPTIQQLINSYDNYSPNYDPSLCYTPGLIYSGGSVVSVTPTSMFDIFSSSDVTQFRNYRDLYLQNCHAPYTQEHCQSVFQGHDLELSLVSKIPDDIQTLHLYQYCRLNLLYPDKNTTTCVGSGVTNGYTGRTNQDIVNDIANGNYTIVAPDYNSIVNNVLTGTAGTEYTGDIITNLQNIYGKFTSFFTTQTGNSTGVLPTYIISMLLVIILFKLFKK